jgi:hypothetical protein
MLCAVVLKSTNGRQKQEWSGRQRQVYIYKQLGESTRGAIYGALSNTGHSLGRLWGETMLLAIFIQNKNSNMCYTYMTNSEVVMRYGTRRHCGKEYKT